MDSNHDEEKSIDKEDMNMHTPYEQGRKYMISSFRPPRRHGSSASNARVGGNNNNDLYIELLDDDDDEADCYDYAMDASKDHMEDRGANMRDASDNNKNSVDTEEQEVVDLLSQGDDKSEGSLGNAHDIDSKSDTKDGKEMHHHHNFELHENENENENQLSMMFEEEVGLKETMLESLNVKLMALDKDIDNERKSLEYYNSTIQSLKHRKHQLQCTHETNMTLMKNVTSTIQKCMQRLRKKLDEKNAVTLEEVSSNLPYPTIINQPKQQSDDADKDQNKNDHHGVDNGSDNGNENDDSNGNADTDESNFDENEKDIHSHNDNDQRVDTDVDANDDNDDHGNEKDGQNDNVRHSKIIESINDSTDQNIQIQPSFIFEKTVQIQPIETDLQYLKKIWSQNHPSHCPMYKHSTLLKEPIFPLHPPVGCPTKLERIIQIAQHETTLRRQEIIQKGDKDLLERDYRKEIEGTCLDIYACSQYDPFYVSLLPTILKASDYDTESEDDDNEYGDDYSNSNGDNNCDDSADAGDKSNGNNFDTNLNTNENEHKSSLGDTAKPKLGDENIIDEKDDRKKSPEGDVDDNAQSHTTIDPHKIICRYDLLGTCKDPSCPYQHLSSTSPTVKRVIRRKGMNKITIDTKKSPQQTNRIDDFVVHLPPLNLPPLPSTLSQGSNLNEVLPKYDISDNEIIYDQQRSEHDNAVDKDESCSSDGDEESHQNLSQLTDFGTNSSKENSGSRINSKKRKAPEISQADPDDDEIDDEDDFIKLPGIHGSENGDDNIDNTLSEGESDDQNHYQSHTQKSNLPLNNSSNFVQPTHLYEALSMFQFEVRKKDIVHEFSQPMNECFEVLYKGISFDEKSHGKHLRPKLSYSHILHVMNVLQLFSNMTDAIRLCVFSGRVDICRAIIGVGKMFLQEKVIQLETAPSDLSSFVKDFNILAQTLLSDIHKFADGYFCGRGSVSYINDFHVQLGLTVISYFIRSYHQTILAQNDCILPEVDRKLLLRRYKRFISLALGMKYDLINGSSGKEYEKQCSFPYHILPNESTRTNFGSSKSTPMARLVKIFESFHAGQKLANYFAMCLYCSNYFDDPQVILDELLHPLHNVMQSHVFSSKSLVTTDVIENTMHGKSSGNGSVVGLPTQLCIFAMYGPSIFAICNGIFILIKKQKYERSEKAIDSRQQGILEAAKSIVMSFIQLFDQSGIAGETFEGQLLLSPLFNMLANILAYTGSYSKTQVLLENTLYAGISNTRVWSVYSESLWSSLIQLRMSFPMEKEHNACTKENVSACAKMLAQCSSLYGLHLSKVNLKGDTSLVQSALFFQPNSCISNYTRERQNNLNDLRNACYILVSDSIDSSETKKASAHIKLVYDNCIKSSHQQFPCSILLVGERIRRLSFVRAYVEVLPLSIGKYLTALKILNLSQNHLENLPNSLKGMKELTKLDIKKNRFTCIPSIISALKSLSTFIASDNMIKDISPLTQNKELNTIDLRFNNIQNVPVELPLDLGKLSRFYLRDDSEKETEMKIVETDPSAAVSINVEDNMELNGSETNYISNELPPPNDSLPEQNNMDLIRDNKSIVNLSQSSGLSNTNNIENHLDLSSIHTNVQKADKQLSSIKTKPFFNTDPTPFSQTSQNNNKTQSIPSNIMTYPSSLTRQSIGLWEMTQSGRENLRNPTATGIPIWNQFIGKAGVDNLSQSSYPSNTGSTESPFLSSRNTNALKSNESLLFDNKRTHDRSDPTPFQDTEQNFCKSQSTSSVVMAKKSLKKKKPTQPRGMIRFNQCIDAALKKDKR